MSGAAESPLLLMSRTTPTEYWNDSCSIEELKYAIERGAVGATSNPAIVLGVLKKEMHLWKDRIAAIISGNPTWSEQEVAWKLIEEMAAKGAEVLLPVFEREKGRKGRLSIQTNPTFYRNAEALAGQAVKWLSLTPNIQVKIPVTQAGVAAIEEATFNGVSINATVCFTVPQALAVGAAVERGLDRRAREGRDVVSMSPVCTIMIGRLDDWMQALMKRDAVLIDPGHTHWAGIACIKKAYKIFKARGFRCRLLAAAYRHHMHWSELIGGDITLTIPCEWQRQFNSSDVEVKPRFDEPVAPVIVETLYRKFPDFRRAFDEDGLAPAEFDSYGASARTLRSFIKAYYDLLDVVRGFMIPDPDLKH